MPALELLMYKLYHMVMSFLYVLSGPIKLMGHEATGYRAYLGSFLRRLQGLYHFFFDGFGAAVGSL